MANVYREISITTISEAGTMDAEGLRKLNAQLHAQSGDTNQTVWDIINPKGSHAIAVGLDAPIEVNVRGSTGYYCAGMNKQATVEVPRRDEWLGW